MIRLEITHSDGEKHIMLHGDTMREVIDKLDSWIPRFDNELKWLKRTRAYKENGDAFLESEKKSGWYYE